ncbi:MAG: TolC family protein [Prolixibacteraceae bacterium]
MTNKFFLFNILFSLTLSVNLSAQEVQTQLTLSQLLDSALQNNYLLKANEKNTFIKQAEIEILRTNYQPTISTSASISTWKFLLPNKQRVLGDALTDVYTDISVRQTIYDGGENKIKKSMVEEEILLNDAVYKQIQNTIIWGVSDVYFEMLKAEREVEAQINSLEQLKSQLQYAENLHKRGKVSKVDILKIKVQMSVVEKNLQKARNSGKAQNIKLKRLCYLENKEEIRIKKVADSLYQKWQNHFFTPDLLYAEAQHNHPALEATGLKMKMEKMQKEIYRSQSMPEVFTYGVGNWEHGYIPFGDNFNYNIGVGVSYTIPFFGGSSHKTKIHQSNLQVEQMEDEKEQDFQDIKEEIDIALNEIRDIQSEISNNEEIMELANETLENALVKYRGGQGTIVDVLDAQTILTEATIVRHKSVLAYLQTIAKLHYITGNNDYPF